MNEYETNGFWRRNLVWFVILGVLVLFGLIFFKGWGKLLNQEIDSMETITGNFSCLPLKDGTTEEKNCTLGVRSHDGSYYALDISRIQDANTDLKAEDTIAVTGFIDSTSDRTNTEWAKYNVSGVVRVNTLLRTR
jgi:hypothetical protein